MKDVIVIVIVLLLVAAGYYFFFQNPRPNTSATEQQSTIPEVSSQTAGNIDSAEGEVIDDGDGPVKTFTIEGQNFSFSPSVMSVDQGDTVRVVFKNVGGFHDFTLDEFGAKTKRINTGEEAVVEFVADKTGSFEYYCSVGTHRQFGMKGTITVNELPEEN